MATVQKNSSAQRTKAVQQIKQVAAGVSAEQDGTARAPDNGRPPAGLQDFDERSRPPRPLSPDDARSRFKEIRSGSQALSEMLEPEDQVVQTCEDVSPTKWHLAHTTWFFERFILRPGQSGYRSPDDQYDYLFNSYYNAVGPQFHRPARGFLSRPTVRQVLEYRAHVDAAIDVWFDGLTGDEWARCAPVLEIGLHHEQQHQELMLTDIKEVLSHNPLAPAPFARDESLLEPHGSSVPAMEWIAFDGGVYEFGHRCTPDKTFAYDNEGPLHKQYLDGFRIADRPVTNGDYLEFMADGGYDDPLLWLSEGWTWRQQTGCGAPHHWRQGEDGWMRYTLSGLCPVLPAAPVSHLSFYEAHAFATWAGARLPTEYEWELAAQSSHAAPPQSGNQLDFSCSADGWIIAPEPRPDDSAQPHRLRQLFGDVWEWTSSPYTPYPGFKEQNGALGEYNGKFMCNQHVLRGGSCATPRGHVRTTYRNFFPAQARWQFSGLRLANHI